MFPDSYIAPPRDSRCISVIVAKINYALVSLYLAMFATIPAVAA